MQLWYMLNPLGDRDKIEGRILYIFLKLVYDPYWDGQQQTLNQLIQEAEKLVGEVKQLCKEQQANMIGGVSMSNIDPNISGDQNDVRNEIEGLWSVNDLVKEFYSLSDKFVDYKRGLVKLPSVKHR